GVGEYDVPDAYGEKPSILVRLAWYAAGIVLVIAVYVIYPGDRDALGLVPPDGAATFLLALGAAAIGVAQAVGIAYARSGGLHPPRARDIPDGVVNAIGTALVDEATFRGLILGLLLVLGVEPLWAVLIQGLAYALATRVGRSGGDWYLILLDLGIGLVGGWLTVLTGGIAAAIVAHAVTRLAVFLATGSADAAPAWGDDEEPGPTDWEFGDDAIPEEVGVASAAAPFARGPAGVAASAPAPAAAVPADRSAPGPARAGTRPGSPRDDDLLPDGGMDDSDASLP
ncbi:MAG: CPBP family glutamic-type intramembrane protease, partial [Chloroflexi bacterium]|nr:CPBP family glutamic-type intramembrane protease [Chloroflexota bacterium]